MTGAERQARHRQRVAAAKREAALRRQPYQPPHGYAKAKDALLAAGHVFERARREFGFEEGVFVDGALLSSHEVIALAELAAAERQRWLDAKRAKTRDDAIGAVRSYMMALRTSLAELSAED
jgi:hypothetical protein